MSQLTRKEGKGSALSRPEDKAVLDLSLEAELPVGSLLIQDLSYMP